MVCTSPENPDTFITLSYWRDIEALHAFALGPTHKVGRDWWSRTAKEHGHIGIVHELYAVPERHWETTYLNFRPLGKGQTKSSVEGRGGEMSRALTEALGRRWSSMLRRMGRVDVRGEDQYEVEQ